MDDPESLIYGMRWPANRLTAGQMRTLRQISRDVRIPITQLLKDAVDLYLTLIQREMEAILVAESEEKPISEPVMSPPEEPASLTVHTQYEIPPRPRQGQLF